MEARIFEPAVIPGKKKFMVTVPWPYTNGSLHVGHGRTYTTGDIVARYKRMRGFNVLYPMGFHQSGTPIHAFSDKIARGDPGTVETYRAYVSQYVEGEKINEILESFKKPENIASYFSKATVNDFTSLGFSIDWRFKFTSAEPAYGDFVQWQFRRLNSRGYIKQGSYPILYSMDDENAVGEDDIADGDIDKVSVEEFTAVKFKGESYSIVAASVRPETIFGITNLWVNMEAPYVLCLMDDEKIVVSKASAEKLRRQHINFSILDDVDPKSLIEERFKVPVTGDEIMVYHSSFVDPDNGTGIVYSVPGHSIWDYVAIKESGIDLHMKKVISFPDKQYSVENLTNARGITSISDTEKLSAATQDLYKYEFYQGRMMDNCGSLSGMSVPEAREKIKGELLESGDAFIFYETSRKAQTRSGSKVIVAVLRDQWFIDYSNPEWKKESHSLVDRMLFVPAFYKENMHETVEWIRERPCARRRGIGTKLPFDDRWVIESLSDSTIYTSVYPVIDNLRKIREIRGKIDDQVLDFIFLGADMPPEYDDVRSISEKARNDLLYWYGCDLRVTSIPHLSNHLVFYIMNHVAVLPKRFEPGGLMILGLVVSRGAKIGKSKGNAVNLLQVTKKYSADVYRLYVATVSDINSQIDWNEEDLQTVIRGYESIISFLERYRKDDSLPGHIETWFESKFYSTLEKFIQDMDSYSVRSAYVRIIFDVMNDLRRVERRGGSVNVALGLVLKEWLISLSAVIPHACEEYWHRYISDTFVSIQVLSPGKDRIDGILLESEAYVDSVTEDIREILNVIRKKPSSIIIETCDESARNLMKLADENRLSEIPQELKRYIPEFMKIRRTLRIMNFDEYTVLEENQEFFSRIFDCKVQIRKGMLGRSNKNSWPGRPAIHVET